MKNKTIKVQHKIKTLTFLFINFITFISDIAKLKRE